MNCDFAGKVALVTGGNSGIGRSTALSFARNGARVVIAARRVPAGEEIAALIVHAGGEAIFVRTDVSQASAVEALIQTIADTYGRLDFAVNNAATFGPKHNTVELSEADWDQVMNVNLKGVWLCMKYEIPLMIKQGGGAIVNMASIASLRAGRTAYTTSKHGLIGLTKSTALQFAPQGVRVNAICPALIETPMVDDLISDPDGRQRLTDLHPIGRLGKPDDIAEAVMWLCSPAAAFVTGHSLVADGGYLL
jgi:NAD(P)-dependent dehydrogenase (short-subunit alcohol dehydrogenase family)